MTNKKTRPQDRWNERNQYISKSYRLYRKDADAFAKACQKAGVSQAGQLTKMMKEFCESQGVSEV